MGEINILVLEIKHSLVIGQDRKKILHREWILPEIFTSTVGRYRAVGTGEWGRGDWEYQWDSYWEIVIEMQ